jgi:glycolate oxidase FAD binding subunit
MARSRVGPADGTSMTPRTVADVADVVREARTAGTALRIVGAGHWLDAGAPVAAGSCLDLGELSGVVEYEPGDLTLTARAATPLAEIRRVTAAAGQWLALDPAGGPDGTIGGTIATGSSGPLATGFGTARSQLLGCEIVTGAGDVVRAGGRVVKNVAGFDITRLMIGAWGTLGVLTEVTLRLRALPSSEATVAIALGSAAQVAHAIRWLRTTEYRPYAAELLTPGLATRLGIPSLNASVLLVRLGGNDRLLAAALGAARDLGEVTVCDADTWRRLATVDAPVDATLRLSVEPAAVVALWQSVSEVADRGALLAHASLMRGIVRCIVPGAADGSADEGTLRGAALIAASCTVVGERLPAAWWGQLREDPVTARLSAGVRRVFDPDTILNHGIMGTLQSPSP